MSMGDFLRKTGIIQRLEILSVGLIAASFLVFCIGVLLN